MSSDQPDATAATDEDIIRLEKWFNRAKYTDPTSGNLEGVMAHAGLSLIARIREIEHISQCNSDALAMAEMEITKLRSAPAKLAEEAGRASGESNE